MINFYFCHNAFKSPLPVWKSYIIISGTLLQTDSEMVKKIQNMLVPEWIPRTSVFSNSLSDPGNFGHYTAPPWDLGNLKPQHLLNFCNFPFLSGRGSSLFLSYNQYRSPFSLSLNPARFPWFSGSGDDGNQTRNIYYGWHPDSFRSQLSSGNYLVALCHSLFIVILKHSLIQQLINCLNNNKWVLKLFA